MTNPIDPTSEPILVVDDEPGIRNVLTRGLWESGFRCAAAGNGEEALARLQQGRYAVMLSDIRMPGMDGVELLGKALAHDPEMSVIMVTAIAGLDTALGAIRNGAYDYVTKPFQIGEVELVIRRALEHRRLRIENQQYTHQLEELVAQRTRQIQEIGLGVITTMALALEAKDEFTHDHSRRVAQLAGALGERLELGDAEVENLRLAGLLHDIGKIGVREAALNKGEQLTPEEYQHVRLHPELGARILSPLHELAPILPAIRHHHERMDGSGYPAGLRGEAIPLGARVLALADQYVSLREERAYRRGYNRERALDEIRLEARRLYDLDVLRALLQLDQERELDKMDQGFPQEIPAFRIS